ncbi:MAG: dipeptide ABC transporter ATP-binding protein [Thermotogae bacterium]|nr:dipeptide ABC transporter ATP-binding protein [Thermotogota bacterium]
MREKDGKNRILRVENLVKYFPIRAGVFKRIVAWVKAVDGVSFDVYEGETLGLVGESGCGKTTVGMTILRLYEPMGGKVYFRDIDMFSAKGERLRKLRQKVQIIFQDPYSSLNPRMRVKNIIAEGIRTHKLASGSELTDRVADLLKKVGLSPDHMNRFPHEFSGGQRQRIGIARALAVNPELIICDEAVSALDVSIQAQILNLLKDLQSEFKLTYIFISHALNVIKHISDKVAVMYLGKIVELADKRKLFDNPLHPYTKALMSAIPIPDPEVRREKIILKGDVPSPINPPSGCRFHTRCPFAKDICKEEEPDLIEIEEGHFVACHFAEKF